MGDGADRGIYNRRTGETGSQDRQAAVKAEQNQAQRPRQTGSKAKSKTSRQALRATLLHQPPFPGARICSRKRNTPTTPAVKTGRRPAKRLVAAVNRNRGVKPPDGAATRRSKPKETSDRCASTSARSSWKETPSLSPLRRLHGKGRKSLPVGPNSPRTEAAKDTPAKTSTRGKNVSKKDSQAEIHGWEQVEIPPVIPPEELKKPAGKQAPKKRKSSG